MIDPRVSNAINKVSGEMDQPEAVGNRLVAWLEALSNGNADTDQHSVSGKCQSIYNAVQLGETTLEDEDEA